MHVLIQLTGICLQTDELHLLICSWDLNACPTVVSNETAALAFSRTPWLWCSRLKQIKRRLTPDANPRNVPPVCDLWLWRVKVQQHLLWGRSHGAAGATASCVFLCTRVADKLQQNQTERRLRQGGRLHFLMGCSHISSAGTDRLIAEKGVSGWGGIDA